MITYNFYGLTAGEDKEKLLTTLYCLTPLHLVHNSSITINRGRDCHFWGIVNAHRIETSVEVKDDGTLSGDIRQEVKVTLDCLGWHDTF